MAEGKKIDEENPIKTFGVILPKLPSLVLKFGKTFLKIKRDAKKAGKIFRKELIKQGIDKETADRFTEIYLESSNIGKFFKNFKD